MEYNKNRKNNEGKTRFMIYSSELIHLFNALFFFSVEDTCGLLKLDKIHTSSNNIKTRVQQFCKKSSHLIYYDDLLFTGHQLNASYNRSFFFYFRYF